jgi:hypothetical protein
MFGTELMVILVSAALRCQPSSVSADWVTSATGQGFGRGHPVSQAEEGKSNRAGTKKCEHSRDPKGRC